MADVPFGNLPGWDFHVSNICQAGVQKSKIHAVLRDHFVKRTERAATTKQLPAVSAINMWYEKNLVSTLHLHHIHIYIYTINTIQINSWISDEAR